MRSSSPIFGVIIKKYLSCHHPEKQTKNGMVFQVLNSMILLGVDFQVQRLRVIFGGWKLGSRFNKLVRIPYVGNP